MNKEQAQIYINNIGQAYKHYTRAVYFGFLFIALVFLGGAVGFCHEIPMVIITCVLAAFAVVFTAVAVKKYMSVLRISVINVVYLALWAVEIDCMAYSIQFFSGLFVWWEYCLCIAIQVVVFAGSAAVCFVVANRAKPKKVMIAGVTVASLGGVVGLSTSRLIMFLFHPDADTALFIITVLILILDAVIFAFIAIFFLRIAIMRKYNVEYKQVWESKNELCAYMNKHDKLTFVCGFTYDKYTFYIYVKRGKFSLEVYNGKTRIQNENYTLISILLDNAQIDGYKLSDIWDEVKSL